jgi:hypothetical protein
MLVQYAANMSSFYFSMIIIKDKSYQNNVIEKINMFLSLFFILFSTLTPFFVLISSKR